MYRDDGNVIISVSVFINFDNTVEVNYLMFNCMGYFRNSGENVEV